MICAIVLAAGLSRRMGTQKLLLHFGGQTMIAHVVDRICASVVDHVFVVVGPDGEEVARAVSDRPVTVVVNPQAASEMLDSVRCGLRALLEGCEAVLVALGDQPSITAELIDAMVAVYASGRIVVPTHAGRRGHPLLLSSQYRHEILNSFGNTGLRGLLQAHPEAVFEFPVSDPMVLSDVDYPEDYRRALAEAEARR